MRSTVWRATLGEAMGRRIVLWGWIASGVLVVLFGVAFGFLNTQLVPGTNITSMLQRALVGGIYTILGLYVGSFLSAFLAMTLAAGSVAPEADSGVLQAVLVRPLPRWRWYLERWAGLVTMSVGYVVAITLAIVGVARVVGGYVPVSLLGLLALVSLEVTFLVTVGMLLSCRLSHVATGVVLFIYFGIAWLGGFISWIGGIADTPDLTTIGLVVSLVSPSDALWKAASAYAAPMGMPLDGNSLLDLPFRASLPPSPWFVAWAVVWTLILLALGLRAFSRRDL